MIGLVTLNRELYAIQEQRGDTIVLRRVRPGIAGARAALGFSQGEMARKLKITQGALSKYETGRIRVPDQVANRVGELLRKAGIDLSKVPVCEEVSQ